MLSSALFPTTVALPKSPHVTQFSELLLPGNGSIPINHIVIVMQENHVYDTYFGAYCTVIGPYCDVNGTGIPPGTCVPLNPANLTQGCQAPYLAAPSAVTAPVDLVHDWPPAHEAYDNGSMDGFYQAEGKQLSTFLYYNGGEIPTYWDLAEEYGLGDNFFASVLSYSTPNHWYLLAGGAPAEGINQTLQHASGSPHVLTEAEEGYLDEANATPTIATLLANSTVSWKYYDYALSTYSQAISAPSGAGSQGSAFDFWNPLASVASSYSPTEKPHFVASSSFFTDAAAGNLPNVSWVLPSFNNSDHPSANINNGEGWVGKIVNAVESSSDWNSTAIFVTWDDYGGYYDNVPPPPLDADGVSFRAPLLVISPYAREGYISHQFSYFESLLHFIEWRYHLPSLTARDADAPLPLDYFDFNASPRAPFRAPAPPTATYPAGLQGLGPPRAPMAFTVSPGSASGTLNWTLSPAGAAVTTYQLTYGPASDPTLTTTREDGSLHSVTISNLAPGIPYQFSLTSITGANSSLPVTGAAVTLAGTASEAPGQPATWTSLPTTAGPAPSPRSGAGFVYDAADHADVLFGGRDASGTYLADTWEYLGDRWVEVYPLHSPGARSNAGMVFESTDGLVLLFGGQGAHGIFGDTWKFLAGSWTNISSTVTKAGQVPSSRAFGALSDNPANTGALLFGGMGSTGVLGDSWRYAKGKWTLLSVKTAPGARSGASITYDGKDGYVLLFGGNSSSGSALNDTWRFSGSAWHALKTVASPGPRIGATMAYDAVDQYTLLFGGTRGASLAVGTWRYLGGGWVLLSPTNSPALRQFASAAFDGLHQGVLAGFGNGSTGPLGDLAEFGLPLSVSLTSSPGFADAPVVEVFYPAPAGGMIPYRYLWDFGDTSHSTLIDATHIYRTPGRFLVNLTVTDSVGATVSSREIVTTDGPLMVHASADRPSPNGTVGFDTSVVGGDGPYQYLWSFGDGRPATSTLAAPTYQYVVPGAYEAVVQVADADGVVATGEVEVSTNTGALPVQVNANVTTGVAPLSVSFNASLPNGTGAVSYLWNFGDGTPNSTTTSPSHTFSSPGTFVVSANVTNASGSWGTSFVAITVDQFMQVHAQARSTGPSSNRSLQFGVVVAGGEGPYTVRWLFGDGTATEGPAPDHQFVAGTFTVVVTVTDRLGTRGDQALIVSVAPASGGTGVGAQAAPFAASSAPAIGPFESPQVSPSPPAGIATPLVGLARWIPLRRRL
ncbi:MAG: PKD domain-containing protein [Thermoplasmata archaeon]|nr:PKD domain-containing protein [Thermoplasmata archaeon]